MENRMEEWKRMLVKQWQHQPEEDTPAKTEKNLRFEEINGVNYYLQLQEFTCIVIIYF